MSTDETLREIEEDVRRARQRLIVNANALLGTAQSTFDILAPVRRHALAGIAAALSGGMLVGRLGGMLGSFTEKKQQPYRTAVPPTPGAMISSLLWRLMPSLAPAVLAFVQQRMGRSGGARQNPRASPRKI